MGRKPWEPAGQTREEVAVSLSNRSAALAGANDHIGALVDATAVVGLKRPWSKGHLRKGKALLALGRPDEALDAVKLGLSFEPGNSVCVLAWCAGIGVDEIVGVGTAEADYRCRTRETCGGIYELSIV
jgi:hypothetical protein